MKYTLLLLLLVGCDTYYVSVKKEYIDRDSLASTFVRSPDPRQEDPPKGQVLVMQWNLPREAMKQQLMMTLKILYRDYEEETVSYPVARRRGTATYALMDKKLKETGGFLSYKVEIVTMDGTPIQEWKQQLWVDVLRLDEDDLFEEALNNPFAPSPAADIRKK